MAPRMATIKKDVQNVRKLIKADRIARAEQILKNLDEKLSGSTKRKSPNKYAQFVQAQYKRFSKQNPTKKAPDILKLIAKEWRAQK